ncbi:hypothetical protein D1O33_24460 (plasmid) [Rhodococcus rhodochrous]|nr:hypothetical protein D1O33_24460 [Rhodococcus rhodochrous]
MSARGVPFSDIQNKEKATLSEWQRLSARPLRVTRRDDEDLVLMTATPAERVGACRRTRHGDDAMTVHARSSKTAPRQQCRRSARLPAP